MFGFLRRVGRAGDPRDAGAARHDGVGDDGPPPVDGSAYLKEHAKLLERFLAEMVVTLQDHRTQREAAEACLVMREIDAMPGERQCDLVVAAAAARGKHPNNLHIYFCLQALQSRLMRRDLPFEEKHLAALLGYMPQRSRGEHCPTRATARAIERKVLRHGLTAKLREVLERFIARMNDAEARWGALGLDAEQRELWRRIEALLAGARPSQSPQAFTVEKAALDWLGRGAGPWNPWPGLLSQFRKSCPARPEERWLRAVGEAAGAIERELFVERVEEILGGQALPGHADPRDVTLRQFVWAAATVPDARLVAALGRLAKARYKPGPQDAVGNAAIRALAEIGTHEAIGQLARLKQAIKSKSARAALHEAIERVKECSGLSDGEVEEIAVPTYELDAGGARAVAVGGFEAVIRLGEDRSVALTWRAPDDGREQKTVPAAVKRDHGRELGAVRQTVRALREELRLQRRRIEELMAADRRWRYRDWCERYPGHPVAGAVARNLIWRFEADGRAATGVWRDGRPVAADDTPVDGLGHDAAVSLWHPVDAAPGEIEAWRGWIGRHAVRQPFKQAFREAYAPTPAELETATYSNRFAGHFIREGQFASLRRARDWSAERIGMFDAGGPPSRRFEAAGIEGCFAVEPVAGGPDGPTGLPLYAATEQVFFVRPESGWDYLPIVDVPARVFSETMRDVDLFVSVCSIGADPNWEDQGAPGEMRQYWRRYLDTPLFGSGRTRHEVLADVLPRLKIADRCALDDRHVLVRGNRLHYRINLGSAAVFAEPSGRHLCIVADVPGPRAYERLLPFESVEDPVLATILAKMFLLAADDRVVDPGIRHQIDQAACG